MRPFRWYWVAAAGLSLFLYGCLPPPQPSCGRAPKGYTRDLSLQFEVSGIVSWLSKTGVEMESRVRGVRRYAPAAADFGLVGYRLCEARRDGDLTGGRLEDAVRRLAAMRAHLELRPFAVIGTVTDNRTGDPVPGARVALAVVPPRAAETDEDGAFALRRLNAWHEGRSYGMSVRRPKFHTFSKKLMILRDMPPLQIELRPRLRRY